LRPNA